MIKQATLRQWALFPEQLIAAQRSLLLLLSSKPKFGAFRPESRIWLLYISGFLLLDESWSL